MLTAASTRQVNSHPLEPIRKMLPDDWNRTQKPGPHLLQTLSKGSTLQTASDESAALHLPPTDLISPDGCEEAQERATAVPAPSPPQIPSRLSHC